MGDSQDATKDKQVTFDNLFNTHYSYSLQVNGLYPSTAYEMSCSAVDGQGNTNTKIISESLVTLSTLSVTSRIDYAEGDCRPSNISYCNLRAAVLSASTTYQLFGIMQTLSFNAPMARHSTNYGAAETMVS